MTAQVVSINKRVETRSDKFNTARLNHKVDTLKKHAEILDEMSSMHINTPFSNIFFTDMASTANGMLKAAETIQRSIDNHQESLL